MGVCTGARIFKLCGMREKDKKFVCEKHFLQILDTKRLRT